MLYHIMRNFSSSPLHHVKTSVLALLEFGKRNKGTSACRVFFMRPRVRTLVSWNCYMPKVDFTELRTASPFLRAEISNSDISVTNGWKLPIIVL